MPLRGNGMLRSSLSAAASPAAARPRAEEVQMKKPPRFGVFAAALSATVAHAAPRVLDHVAGYVFGRGVGKYQAGAARPGDQHCCPPILGPVSSNRQEMILEDQRGQFVRGLNRASGRLEELQRRVAPADGSRC